MNNSNKTNINRIPRPDWLKVKAPGGENYVRIKNLLNDKQLHTVCEEAHCPNIGECWSCGTATFIILGDVCSRNCRFCAVSSGKPQPPDPAEPLHVAESIKAISLRYAVITSVTRDDLPDGGAEHWSRTIQEIKRLNPETKVEVLIPDFNGDEELLKIALKVQPDVLNHNVETVPSLYERVRPQAAFDTSLKVLRFAKTEGMRTKTGIMVGLGETKEEVIETMRVIRDAGVEILTIGQYLQPSAKHLPVSRYVTPEEFAEFKQIGLEMGFSQVESAPLVRSSYHAGKHC
jgi:lipoic acid synthetase